MRIALILLSVMLSACAASKVTHENISVHRVVNIESPKEDAERAIAEGDFRLIVVTGYSAEIPGSDISVSEAKREYGVREFEGVSDSWQNEDDAARYRQAIKYAEAYNATITSSGKK